MRFRRVRRESPNLATGSDGVLTYGSLTLDLAGHLAFGGQRTLRLSHLQFVVLAALVRGGGRVVATSDLLGAAATVIVPSPRTVPAVISRLRRELRREDGLPAIVLVRSRGYRMVA